jgi:hypothetical protein
MEFYVVRTYSHTDKQQLWKILSRRFKEQHAAESWKSWMQEEWRLEHPRARRKPEFFVVAVNLPEVT